MIIGVMSDTHGNRPLMHNVAEDMRGAGAAIIFHLGDDYGDAEELGFAGFDVRTVPGFWCAEYRNRAIPNLLQDTVAGLPLACAHGIKDLKDAAPGTQLLMHGHTHRAEIQQDGDAVYINPGHLKAPRDRGQQASYALVRIEADGFVIAIHELNRTIREQQSFARPLPPAPEEQE